MTLTLSSKSHINQRKITIVILGHSHGVLFVVNTFLRKLLQTKYLQPLFLTMAAILDAILDFSARTNFRQCIPLVSQTTGYKIHFGICHVLLYFYEHPTFILALKVTLLLGQESNMAAITKNSKTIKIYFFLRNH